jgi:hypothetical protein
MTEFADVDTAFDLRSDARGKDPDRYSPALRRFHQLLWSKPLPSGEPFDLVDTFSQGGYLTHCSGLGTFKLSSDTIVRTFRNVRRMGPIIDQIPDNEREQFSRLGYTIGGMMLFPRERINGMHTINQARGTSRQIEDRFDLTLEAVRRHFTGESSPLSNVLERYRSFFDLFDSFVGYVEFWLLQDLVDEGTGRVRFFLPFDGFRRPAFPNNLNEYVVYRASTLDFVRARNARIDASTV